MIKILNFKFENEQILEIIDLNYCTLQMRWNNIKKIVGLIEKVEHFLRIFYRIGLFFNNEGDQIL